VKSAVDIFAIKPLARERKAQRSERGHLGQSGKNSNQSTAGTNRFRLDDGSHDVENGLDGALLRLAGLGLLGTGIANNRK
jgi:hypothetical protein